MGSTKPGQALGRLSLLSISLKLLTLSGILLFSTNLFRLASILALLVGLNLFFLIGSLVWFFKITKVFPFESVEVFRKDPFLAVYFSLSINDLPASLPSSVSGSLRRRFGYLVVFPLGSYCGGGHKQICFDWSTSLSTGVFLSIRENVRPPQSIPNKLTFSQTSFYSAPVSRFNPTPTFLGVTFDRTLCF